MTSAAWLLGASTGMMLLYGALYAGSRVESWPGSALKTLAVLGLTGVGWAQEAPWLAIVGVGLGALGDFALSRPGERAFLAGTAAFALGHLAYAAMFLGVAGQSVAVVPLLVLLGLALSTEVWLVPRAGELRWPVRGYVVVICVMAAAAMMLSADHGVSKLGAALFVASDVMLALEMFVLRHPGWQRGLAIALWPTYWIAQALIVIDSRWLDILPQQG